MLFNPVNSITRCALTSRAITVRLMNKPRKEPEPWQQEDAERLLRIYEKRKGALSQEEFADRSGLGTQGNVWQYLNGRIPLNVYAASAFAAGLQCSVEEFSPRLAAEIAALKRNVTDVVSPPVGRKVELLDDKLTTEERNLIHYIVKKDRKHQRVRDAVLAVYRALTSGGRNWRGTGFIDTERPKPKQFRLQGGNRGGQRHSATAGNRKRAARKGATGPAAQSKKR